MAKSAWLAYACHGGGGGCVSERPSRRTSSARGRRSAGLPARGIGPQATPARGGHVVDLALLFAELLRAPGTRQADLGRRYRKSPGYVSVVCRLGRALQEMAPEARDVLRVPHFTLKAAQALVSRYRDPAALRAAATRLAATPSIGTTTAVGAGAARVRARQGAPGQWDRAPDGPDPIDPLPEPANAMSRRDTFVYAWDADAARRDPGAVLAGFEAFVRATTDEVVVRLRRLAGDLGPPPRPAAYAGSPDAGGRRRPRVTPDAAVAPSDAHERRSAEPPGHDDGARVFTHGCDETALRRLDARVAETLRAHRARMDAFLAERDPARTGRLVPGPPVGSATGPGGSFTPLPVDPADIDADLA